MVDLLMYITRMTHKNTPSVDYNERLKSLNSQLNKPTNQNLVRVPKVVKQTNKKTLLKILGTSVINSPLSPPLSLLTTLKVDLMLIS